jgi:hypothetical protein
LSLLPAALVHFAGRLLRGAALRTIAFGG